ncbi:glycerol-3-phosphate dehydrogenase (FAD-dependent), putative [Trypanosoma brucei gambiense DAL972]|uniref:Glycerol-3-phosphate dehydrogenase (FAD-dependent), putative n=1 Tax=Trypanosoma brucei gambiense (strain MHOM/CI/86/DAL972) TaxID=679716 RepID=C9ZI64_TRYB9|nr:glycerol-3-phosphate dehydrogenase (FAD-dependent), putative [Trypanosoma brucei gambiense DAL972]CBH08856.1 glycerol-3-phosphate dehydrogenase (FAD-dependent), putative [Trypanosoma brucei gambiense DAL972]|eukprot:XP_011771297.1 glycerol-3-phosphate dehydrogenase (FAD-dependent), putative [Trypanosoma brucei gambiense DAL972]
MGRYTRRFTFRVGVGAAAFACAWAVCHRWNLRRSGVISFPEEVVHFQPLPRDLKLRQMKESSSFENPFDALIIGGGVTGLYTAVDAAKRGLRVAVVGAGDFASGYSGTSPPLLPGAFPYVQRALRQRDAKWLRRAAEAWEARTIWSNVAPSIVNNNVRTLVPSAHAMEFMELAATAVVATLLSPFFGPWRSCSFVRGKHLLEEFPGAEDKAVGAIIVRDATVDGAAAAIALARTADALGAVTLNYAQVERITGIDNESTSSGRANFVVTISDVNACCGLGDVATSKVEMYTRSIVNCAGALVDEVKQLFPGNSSDDVPTAVERHQLSSYLVMPATALFTGERITGWAGSARALMASSTSYAFSSVMIVPWFDECVLLGPSVTPFSHSPTRAAAAATISGAVPMHSLQASGGHASGADDSTCERICAALKASGVEVDKGRILSCISTVVPVLRDPSSVPWLSNVLSEGYHIAAGGENRHRVHIYGGSLGLARLIAEKAVDKLLNNGITFNVEEVKRLRPCETKWLPLVFGSAGAGMDYYDSLSPLERVRTLVREQYAVRLVDVVSRRTRIAYSSPAEALAALPALAELMRVELGWSSRRAKWELEEARSFILAATALT